MPKMTLNKLAQEMHDGFNRLEKSIDNKIDRKIGELAVLVKKGFDNTATKSELELLETGQNEIARKVTNLELGQEDILLKLDNYAYKFEVNELKKRATKTEGRLNALESKKK